MSKSNSVEFVYLSQEDVIAAGGLNMKMAMDSVEKGFRLLSRGKYVSAPKIVVAIPPSEKAGGRMNGLAGYIGGAMGVAGIKWIPSFPSNPQKRNLPRANALIILNDIHTGMPLAVMDGTIISAMRTGAVAGIGAKYLAREDSEILGIIGMSVQAKTQAMALKEALPSLKEIRAYRRKKSLAKNDAKEIQKLTGIKTVIVDSPKDAVDQADVIVTATTADEPIVKDDWVKEGSLFIHIGTYVEEEYAVVLHSNKVVVDDWEGMKHRKTQVLARMFQEGLLKDDDIYANLDEIVNSKKVGRETKKERVFLSTVGMALEDLSFASKIYEQASKKSIGKTLSLWKEPKWF